jgi:hypothetical protein
MRPIVLAAVVATTIAVPGLAQPGGVDVIEQINSIFRGKLYLGPSVIPARPDDRSLLRRPLVQEELKLGADQLTRLNRVDEEFGEAATQATKAFSADLAARREAGDPDAYELAKTAYMAAYEALDAGADRERARILNRNQQERLAEIRLQWEGPLAFLRPDFQDRLDVDPDRRVVIRRHILEGMSEMSRAGTLPPSLKYFEISAQERIALKKTDAYKGAVARSRSAALKVREEMMRQVLRTLSERQRERYKAMLGKPFDREKAQVPRKAS